MKKIFTFIISAALTLLILCSCNLKKEETEAAQSTDNPGLAFEDLVPEIEKSTSAGVFTVGMECNKTPFSWLQSTAGNGAIPLGDGTYVNGYDVQVAKKIAQSLNRELKIIKIEWDSLPGALIDGKVDAVISDMSATAERAAVLTFSANYYESDLVVVVKNSSRYAQSKSISGFSGANLTAQINTTHYSAIDQIPGAVKSTALKDVPALCLALASDKIDGFVTEKPTGISAALLNPDLMAVEIENGFNLNENDASAAVALKKGSGLLNGVNNAINKISVDEQNFIMDTAVNIQPGISSQG